MKRKVRLRWGCGAAVGILAVVLAVSAWPAAAQIRLGLRVEHQDVLQFEAIRTFITVYNDTPEPLSVGGVGSGAQLELHIAVDDSAGLPATRISDTPLFRKELVLPGTDRTFLHDVSRRYRMVGMGRYRVLVVGHWQDNRYESNPVMVNVVAGLVLKEVKKVVSGYPDRMRTYSLRYWRRAKEEHLFLRVDELAGGASMNYGTIDLGRVIRFFPPRLTVDRDGLVKVVHQSGRDCYTRSLFRSDPDRLRFVDQTYHLPNGDPYPNLRGGTAARRGASGQNAKATNDTETIDN